MNNLFTVDQALEQVAKGMVVKALIDPTAP